MAAVGSSDRIDASLVQVEPGLRLGPYEVIERIGAGGMGVVYRARDVRLDRIVALKILPPSAARHAEARRRFEREARMISSLNHPNICALFDIGCHENVDFLVMEFLEGETLAGRLEGGPLPRGELIRYATEIADALSHAHRQDVIHRDLKPSNIVLTEPGAKLLDFGIAKLHGADAEAVGGIIGTVAYMSPEQVRGDQIDARSDLFSFGAVLYEMATGRRPFLGDKAEQVFAAIQNRGAAPVLSVNPDIDGRLPAIIEKALEPDRERRYQRADDLHRDLRQLEHTPRRTSWLVATAATVIAIAAAGGIFLRSDRATPAAVTADVRSVAVLPFKPLVPGGGEPDYIGVALADALITELSAVRSVAVRPLSESTRYGWPDDDPIAAGRALNADIVVDGAMHRSGDRLRVLVQLVRVADGHTLWSDRFDSPWHDVFRVQDAIADQVARALAVTLTGEDRARVLRRRTGNFEAYDAYLKGRYFWQMRTAAAHQKALAYFEQAIQLDPTFAPAHAGLADTFALLGSLAVATLPPAEAGQKAVAAAARALEIDETLAEAHVSFAFATYSVEWNWAEGERHFKRAIELDPNYATARHWYALCLGQRGRLDEALVTEPMPRIVHEDASHQLRRDGKEVGAVLPLCRSLIDQLDVRLVHQSRRLERVVRPLLGEISSRLRAQFRVDQRDQTIERFPAAVAPFV